MTLFTLLIVARTNVVVMTLFTLSIGSRIDLKNNDNKRPLDLTKDPEVAVILREAGGALCSLLLG